MLVTSHSRNLRDHFNNVNCAVLSVGGWYDAEDPLGPFAVYYGTTANNADNDQVRWNTMLEYNGPGPLSLLSTFHPLFLQDEHHDNLLCVA